MELSNQGQRVSGSRFRCSFTRHLQISSRRVLSLLLGPAEEHVHLELDKVKALWIFQYSLALPPSACFPVFEMEGGSFLERRWDAACKKGSLVSWNLWGRGGGLK